VIPHEHSDWGGSSNRPNSLGVKWERKHKQGAKKSDCHGDAGTHRTNNDYAVRLFVGGKRRIKKDDNKKPDRSGRKNFLN